MVWEMHAFSKALFDKCSGQLVRLVGTLYQAAFEKVREMVKKHMRRYESGICIADCYTPFDPLENGCNEKILA